MSRHFRQIVTALPCLSRMCQETPMDGFVLNFAECRLTCGYLCRFGASVLSGFDSVGGQILPLLRSTARLSLLIKAGLLH